MKEWDHDGEVNRARANLTNVNLIASLTKSGDVHVFHIEKNAPSSVLKGLIVDGFGLSWKPQEQGIIIAGSGDTICGWDLNNKDENIFKIDNAHQNTVNDVKFSPMNPNLFISASDDGHFKIWDIRT